MLISLKHKTCFLFLFFLWDAGISFAQSFSFAVLNQENGLSNDAVTCIVQDSIGFIWIGTKQGLNRYDGSSFKLYSRENTVLSSDDITDLLIDDNGRIWVSTANGELAYYDSKSNSLKLEINSNTSLSKSITKLYQNDNGFIWLGTEEGLFLFNKQTKNLLKYSFAATNGTLIPPVITDILTHPSGSLFVSTFGHGLWRLKEGQTQLNRINFNEKFIATEYLLTLQASSSAIDEVLIGTQGDGLLNFNIHTLEVALSFSSTNYKNSVVRTINYHSPRQK